MRQREDALRTELAGLCRKVYDKGYTSPLNGNMSVRLDAHTILITPSQVAKGSVREEMLLVVDIEGNVLQGDLPPSIETNAHLEIYKRRCDVNCVLHAHPLYVLSFAVAQRALDAHVLPESAALLGDIGVVLYHEPGSTALAQDIGKKSEKCDALLWMRHGMSVAAETLPMAFYKLEVMEILARTVYQAEVLRFFLEKQA